MTNIVKPWGSIELAVKALLMGSLEDITDLPDADRDARVGGDFAYEPGGDPDFYLRVFKVGGVGDRFEGFFTVNIETWGSDFLETDSRANRVDALVLGYPHVVEVGDQKWVFDRITQTAGPQELPWEDDAVTRMGSTYVITARRR